MLQGKAYGTVIVLLGVEIAHLARDVLRTNPPVEEDVIEGIHFHFLGFKIQLEGCQLEGEGLDGIFTIVILIEILAPAYASNLNVGFEEELRALGTGAEHVEVVVEPVDVGIRQRLGQDGGQQTVVMVVFEGGDVHAAVDDEFTPVVFSIIVNRTGRVGIGIEATEVVWLMVGRIKLVAPRITHICRRVAVARLHY